MSNLFKDIDTLIFDNDGTLFQADLVSFPAIVSAYKDLIKIFNIKIDIISKDEINSKIGLPHKDFFRSLLPENCHQYLDEFEKFCIQHEVSNIKKGRGVLYPHVKETLAELTKRNYSIGIITNAGAEYFNAVAEFFDYNRMVNAYLCLGDRPHCDKSDLLRELLQHFKSKKAVMIGDNPSDIAAGKKHKCKTIAVLHGYSTAEDLKEADELVENFQTLLEFF